MVYVLYFILVVMVICTIGYCTMAMVNTEINSSSKKELLKKYYTDILNEVLENGFGNAGICKKLEDFYYTGDDTKITHDNYIILRNHFKEQKPKWNKHRKFYKHYLFDGTTYWWPINNWKNHSKSTIEQANEQRIEFIKHLIIKLS